jgi:hypothetical protein
MSRIGVGLALALAGCAGAPGPLAPANVPGGARFLPDARGLGVDGTGLRIDFGRSPAGVIAALDRELGPGRALGLDGCGAGINRQMAWGDLVLTFTNERFAGWRQAGRSAGEVCGALA